MPATDIGLDNARLQESVRHFTSDLRRRSRRARLTGAVLAGLVLTAATAATAVADPYTLGTDVNVSSGSNLGGCTAGASPSFSEPATGSEVEPQIAVNPTNPAEITGVVQQDRWPDGGARGLTSWMSTDGGTSSWAKLPDVPWSACQGGPERFLRATDPWVSYDKGGNLYLIGEPLDSSALRISAISVTTWDGTNWRAPQILIEDSAHDGTRTFNDKPTVTGDPTREGYAYATWNRCRHPAEGSPSDTGDSRSFARRCPAMFSRTTDGGLTWSTPEQMRPERRTVTGNQIAVAPDGTLYDVYVNHVTGWNLDRHIAIMRSDDAGRTWSVPVEIAHFTLGGLFVPDDRSKIVAGTYLPDLAIDPGNGDIYVVWSDGRGTPIHKVLMAKSTDGGRHWSAPAVVATGGPDVQSYNASIEVTGEGTLVLTYYDDRNNDPSDGIATTDVWLRHSHDGATSWEPEQHLHGPFDHKKAPVKSGGVFLGDYMGLQSIAGNDVISFFASTISDGADVHAIRAAHHAGP